MREQLGVVMTAVAVLLGGLGVAEGTNAADWPPRSQWPQLSKPKSSSVAEVPDFANPKPVAILGYDGDAMEPFFSRDGKYLFFNNNNNPSAQTDLFWAERVEDITFQFRGPVNGANVPGKLDGVPSMTKTGEFFFITDRSYDANRSTIYRGKFSGGTVTDVGVITGISPVEPGIVNFDAEISGDGKFLYAVYGDLTSPPVPKTANLFVARRTGEFFERLPDSAKIMANVNTPDLEYAPSTTPGGLHLYFTRMNRETMKTTIEYSFRRSLREPFGPSETITAIKGFVEAPCITPDNNVLFYHTKIKDHYRIYAISRK